MESKQLQDILEAALFAADSAMPISQLALLFDEKERPSNSTIKEALTELQAYYTDRGVELKCFGTGYRFQSRQDFAPWIRKLWEERPARYSRALLETLVLIAYRQPITRADIESVRGVAVSTNIIKTLLEREWVKVVGQREVPGRPSLYGTTKQFLDYFNLESLNELPGLEDIRSLDDAEEKLVEQLELVDAGEAGAELIEGSAGEGTEASADEVEAASELVEASSEESEAGAELTDEPSEDAEAVFELADEEDDKTNAEASAMPQVEVVEEEEEPFQVNDDFVMDDEVEENIMQDESETICQDE